MIEVESRGSRQSSHNGFWKDRAFWYQAWWGNPTPPVLHIFPHWTWSASSCRGACQVKNDSLFVDIWVYSNADEVELWLPNGGSLGRISMSKFSHVQWAAVPYMPGALRAAAYVGGAQVPG